MDASAHFIGKTLASVESGLESVTRLHCIIFEFTDGSSFWIKSEDKLIIEYIEGVQQ